MGLLAALLAALVWGTYLVPIKRVGRFGADAYQVIAGFGILALSIALVPFGVRVELNVPGLVAGLLWSAGNMISIMAMERLGVGKAGPIWQGVVILTSLSWGLLFFHEAMSGPVLGALAIVLLLAGVATIGATPSTDEGGNTNWAGIGLAAFAGLFFGTYLVPMRYAGLPPERVLFPMSIGIVLGSAVVAHVKRPNLRRELWGPGLVSGAMWNVANYASFFAIRELGLAVGFPLMQLALFVGVAWSILVLGEFTSRRHVMQLGAGALVLFVGAVCLTLAR